MYQSAIGRRKWDDKILNDSTTNEAALGNLRFFNPAVPGTLTSANAASGTFLRKYEFKYMKVDMTWRCASTNGGTVTAMIVLPKRNGDDTPLTTFTNGIADQGVGGALVKEQPSIWITDSAQFNEKYKIVKKIHKHLEPGQQLTLSYNTGCYRYDPTAFDDDPTSVRKDAKQVFMVASILGDLVGEQGNPFTVTYGQTSMQFMMSQQWKVEYDAGCPGIRDIVNQSLPGTTMTIQEFAKKPASAMVTYAN
jgi:hypothetical protein